MSDILPFPTRNKGRVRKSRSPDAMGRCSFSLLERDGISIPANVTDIRTARQELPADDIRVALRLALALFAVLDADQKKEIRNAVRSVARHDDGNMGVECRALYRLLTGEAMSC